MLFFPIPFLVLFWRISSVIQRTRAIRSNRKYWQEMDGEDEAHECHKAKYNDNKGDNCRRTMPGSLTVLVCIHTGQTLHSEI